MMLIEFDKEFFGRRGADFVEKFRKNSNLEFQYVNMNQHQSVFLFGESPSFERRETAQKLQRDIYQFFGEKCYIAVSEYSEKPLDLQKCYEQLENLMENKFYLLDSNIFLEHDEKEEELEKTMEDDLLMKQIRQDIKMKDMVGLRTHFDSLCEKYKGKTIFSQMYVKFVFSNLMNIVRAKKVRSQVILLWRMKSLLMDGRFCFIVRIK